MGKNNCIIVKGARVHNLKSVDVEIPRKQFVVITGVSGSGKSSLAFDTLYAEGQRRYVESLSAYARQFLDRMEKPDVDYIQGLSPAMAIEQRKAASNPRSTVGTTTEIYDYLKLLFAKAGKTYSPISGDLVTRDTVSDIVSYVMSHPDGTRVSIMTTMPVRSQGLKKELELALQKGFTRIIIHDEVTEIEDLLSAGKTPVLKAFTMLIDRVVVRKGEEADEDHLRGRLADSIQTAYLEGQGRCLIQIDRDEIKEFSDKFEKDGMVFEIPSVNLFSFNNPYGACKTCEGFGRILGIDEDLVIPNKNLSLYEGAVAPWRGERMDKYQQDFIREAEKADWPIHRAIGDLTADEYQQLWEGLGKAWGINRFFDYVRSKMHKIQYRVMLSRYRGYTTCPDCKGSRIRKDANYVKVDGHSISEFLSLEITDLLQTVKNIQVDEKDMKIAGRILKELVNRLGYLDQVGLGYLSLNRKIGTLSGGEMQRIKLATSLGSGLTGAMYILDEPSIGLHPKDTDQLIEVLKGLRDIGNSVIVVEHDEHVIRTADHIVDIGPGAGELGGQVIFSGSLDELLKAKTLTSEYLHGTKKVPVPETRRKKRNSIRITGAREHNLKGVDIEIPLHAMTVVTGVSGSGKTSLIKGIVYPAIRQKTDEFSEKPGSFNSLEGDIGMIKQVELVDQSPIGRSSRSNPATYLKVWDYIRELYSSQPMAKMRGMTPGYFSFNVEGGRCEMCKGEGEITIEMQFLPDIRLTCEACNGKRFKQQVLDVTYRQKNVDDILGMTISEAEAFFADEKKIAEKLAVLNKVGLGYLRLGQSSATLSGGEAQRLKLASFLAQSGQAKQAIYFFDEPTTGLHFDDINKLLFAMNELIEQGNTVVVIEHNLDVIKCADWIIDLGPGGGKNGGKLVFQGTPEDLAATEGSQTAAYLKDKL